MNHEMSEPQAGNPQRRASRETRTAHKAANRKAGSPQGSETARRAARNGRQTAKRPAPNCGRAARQVSGCEVWGLRVFSGLRCGGKRGRWGLRRVRYFRELAGGCKRLQDWTSGGSVFARN
ncbi:hypothetical protein GCM10009828_000640 [Actinoplanes couchii]